MTDQLADKIIILFSTHVLVAIVTLMVYLRFFNGC